MVGLLVIIVISWVLLHFIEKENIDVLGIVPNGKRIAQFAIGLMSIMLINFIVLYVESHVQSIEWQRQTNINYQSILNSFVYHLKSALTEDLVFRGAILYILIKKFGSNWGIFSSAFCFGVYHIFSYGMLDSGYIEMVFVALITGFTGFIWGYTFHKTKSILLGLGFHLGYNVFMTFFYKSQPYGELLYTMVSKVNLTGWTEFYFFLFKGFFPGIAMLLLVKLLLRSNISFFEKGQISMSHN